MQFHVAGALELLVDHVVHPAARVDQRGRDDRDAAPLLDLPGRAEEPLGAVQRRGVEAARERPAAWGNHQVVRTGKPGQAVEQDDDVAVAFDEPFGALQHQVGDLDVLLRRAVEGGGHHLGLHGAAHVGHLFGPLIEEEHHEVHFLVVLHDALADLLEEGRLPGFRR